MMTIMRLINLLLCLEIVLMPVKGSIFLPIAAFAQNTCPQGQTYNSSVNRCLTSSQVLKVNNAVQVCTEGDRECYRNNATNALKDSGAAQHNSTLMKNYDADKLFNEDGKYKNGKLGVFSKTMNAATIGIPLVVVTSVLLQKSAKKSGKSFSCKPASLMLMYGAAAALGVGEIYGYFNHKARLKAIQKEWDAKIMPKAEEGKTTDAKRADATEAQSEAFEYLARNEEQVAKTAKTKKGFYIAATGLFSAGALMAAIEHFKLNAARAALVAPTTDPATKLQAQRTIASLTCHNDVADPKRNEMRLENEKTEQEGVEKKEGSFFNNQEKLKRVAAYNLSTAQDAQQLLELMKEYEAIEFENYTRLTYLEKEEHQVLKDIKLPTLASQIMAGISIPEAMAQDKGAKTLGFLGATIPLFTGMSSILKNIKFQGGQPISAAELNKLQSTTKSWVVNAISKPVNRVAINGVLGSWMGIMTSHMNKQQKLSKERAEMLRKVKADFVSANGLMYCTDADRNDQSKPKCYCFDSNNKLNVARATSSICSQAYQGLNSAQAENQDDKVCVNQDMEMDSACSCKSNNSCLKSTRMFSMKGFSPGTFRMINTGTGPADDLFNGVTSAGDITDSASFNAAKIKDAADSMMSKTDPKAAKEADTFGSGLEKSLVASAGGLSMGNSSGGSDDLPKSPSAAAAALEKELKQNKDSDIEVTKAGQQIQGAGFGSIQDEKIPEFGMSESQAANQEIEIAEVMNQKVDFGNNDINKGSDTNLFEVLSFRYQRSGMRRLFEDQVQTEADKPAKTDIVE